MTKEEITARLQELAAVLGRDADISGSKADLEQRLAEWEEELSDGSDGLYKDDEEPQQKNETRSERGESENRNSVDMVMVKAVVMLHVNALHATRDNPVAFVRPGEVFRVSAVVAVSMAESGLVKMC
ncbi:DNA-packaging protein FI [Escherichia coli]|nr:DNA packaging protein [Escherichia coli]EEW2032967.1 DNA packaging protein [Escherichia coli]ELM5068018.1 DNA packaging protein [Escherichia coli]MBB8780568.1 DNA packaging protein [Escherichia coli]